ncbi:hypothetical protein MNBD_ACTINO01-680, partial [hydrothermal vent metagenome]
SAHKITMKSDRFGSLKLPTQQTSGDSVSDATDPRAHRIMFPDVVTARLATRLPDDQHRTYLNPSLRATLKSN